MQTTPEHPKRSAAKVNSCPNDPLHLGIIQRFKVAKKLDLNHFQMLGFNQFPIQNALVQPRQITRDKIQSARRRLRKDLKAGTCTCKGSYDVLEGKVYVERQLEKSCIVNNN